MPDRVRPAGGAARAAAGLLAYAAALLAPAAAVLAWGPHSEITKAALEVLPERDRWNAELGAANLAAFAEYCWMPDARGTEAQAYYVDDYLLIRALPVYVGHIAPQVKQAFVPHFKRCLQALRTETPENACRQIGPLLHFIEDIGAPPHTAPNIPQHGPLEEWVKADAISIRGYRPQLLGRTDEEALAGLLKRAEELRAFSAERCELALPRVKLGESERPQVEPTLLECANESARVAADFLYTVFTLGLAKGPEGAGLEGVIEAPALIGNDEKGARVILLDNVLYEEMQGQGMRPGNFIACATNYATLAVTSSERPPAGAWRGEARFRNLQPGAYRVLAYRPGAQRAVSAPVVLEAGRVARVQLTLSPTDPPGNLILNPDGELAYLARNVPDRWRQTTSLEGKGLKARVWASAKTTAPGPAAYRCGAILKDPAAKVRFWFDLSDPMDPKTMTPNLDRWKWVDLAAGDVHPAEVRYAVEGRASVFVTIETNRPWAAAVDRVWMAPATDAAPR